MSSFTDQIDFTNGPPTRPYTKPIPFTPTAVYVDNYTAYWLFFRDAQMYVPPYYIGVCLILLNPTGNEYFEVKQPSGQPQTPSVNGSVLQLKWQDGLNIYNRGVDSSALSIDISGQLAAISAGITLIESNTGVGGSLETDLASIIRNTQGLLTMTANQITVHDRAFYGGHNLAIATHPYTNNTYITLFNNDANNTFYVLDSDTDLFGVGTPIKPNVQYAINIAKLATLDLYIVAATGLTADVRQQFGTYS